VKDLTLFANTILSIFYNVLSLKLYPEVGYCACPHKHFIERSLVL